MATDTIPINWQHDYITYLEDLIRAKPLTKRDIREILKEISVSFHFIKDGQNENITIPKASYYNPHLLVNPKNGLEIVILFRNSTTAKISLLHEICHARYEYTENARSIEAMALEGEWYKRREDLLELETHRFYHKNRNFMDRLYLELSIKYGNRYYSLDGFTPIQGKLYRGALKSCRLEEYESVCVLTPDEI